VSHLLVLVVARRLINLMYGGMLVVIVALARGLHQHTQS
jgi:hypothetical protein